jgi:hypothetical protein
MKKHFLLSFVVLCWGAANGAEYCPSDFTGTFRTNQPELPNSSLCLYCREINQFPNDIRNFIWNWVVIGSGSGQLVPGQNDIGHYVYNVRMDVAITTFDSNILSTPVCNTLGQCATATLQINFSHIRIPKTPIRINTGIRNFDITVTLPNGNTFTDRFQKQMVGQGPLPIPADNEPDPTSADACLNNYGDEREEDVPAADAGIAGFDWEDPYQHWHDEEAAYGGRVPFDWTYRCGTVGTVQGSGTTCGWFLSL